MRVSIVIGNPKPSSRTLKITQAVADRITDYLGADRGLTIDLIDHASSLFEWPNAKLAELGRDLAESDIVLFGSPTYKASYTGLLKAFLDRYGNNALRGVTAIPVMTASSARHAMAVEFTLRPLLVELGAIVPTRGFFFNIQNMGELDEMVDIWASDSLPNLRPTGSVATGPVPDRSTHKTEKDRHRLLELVRVDHQGHTPRRPGLTAFSSAK